MPLKIHPAIGIARLGNSNDFFVGPQIPGVAPQPPNGQFRSGGKILRQACEFRIYRHEPGQEPEELTATHPDVAAIEWRVQVANRKAAQKNILFQKQSARNPGIPGSDLIISSVSGPLSTPGSSAPLSGGAFRGKPVGQGEVRMAAQGRLLVLGSTENSGFVLKPGESGGYAPDSNGNLNQLNFANNPFWYDTTADGPVTAKVTLQDGSVLEAAQAWVLIAPPDFAPGIGSAVTLFDTLRDLLIRNFQLDTSIFDKNVNNPDPEVLDPHFVSGFKPDFTKDIYPVLNRVLRHKWVFQPAVPHHGVLASFSTLATEPPAVGPDPNDTLRKNIFNRLRHPVAGGGNMPKLFGDEDEDGDVVFRKDGLTLPRTLYEAMRRWRKGFFTGGWNGPPPAQTQITPEGLDRAALESCPGGSFFPGIETNRVVVKRPEIYEVDASGIASEIRIKPATGNNGDRPPGFLSAQNALPWQADFLDCQRDGGSTGWWPAQRPDDVFRGSTIGPPQPWASIIAHHKDMVEKWTDLKFVVEELDVGGSGTGNFPEQA